MHLPWTWQGTNDNVPGVGAPGRNRLPRTRRIYCSYTPTANTTSRARGGEGHSFPLARHPFQGAVCSARQRRPPPRLDGSITIIVTAKLHLAQCFKADIIIRDFDIWSEQHHTVFTHTHSLDRITFDAQTRASSGWAQGAGQTFRAKSYGHEVSSTRHPIPILPTYLDLIHWSNACVTFGLTCIVIDTTDLYAILGRGHFSQQGRVFRREQIHDQPFRRHKILQQQFFYRAVVQRTEITMSQVERLSSAFASTP